MKIAARGHFPNSGKEGQPMETNDCNRPRAPSLLFCTLGSGNVLVCAAIA